MYVRHSDRILKYTRQMGYISDLLETLIGLGVCQKITGGVDSAGDPHLPRLGDLPQIIVNPTKFHNLPMNHLREWGSFFIRLSHRSNFFTRRDTRILDQPRTAAATRQTKTPLHTSRIMFAFQRFPS